MFYGKFKDYYVMVMSKTGQTLHDLWQDANLKLEMNKVSEIAIKAVIVFFFKNFKFFSGVIDTYSDEGFFRFQNLDINHQ